MVFVCCLSDPFFRRGCAVLLREIEGLCGEDGEGVLEWWYARVCLSGVVEEFGRFLNYVVCGGPVMFLCWFLGGIPLLHCMFLVPWSVLSVKTLPSDESLCRRWFSNCEGEGSLGDQWCAMGGL